MPRKLVTYDDWGYGDFGLGASWRAPKGSFSGQNVTVYRNGSIGPHAEPKLIPLTGLPAGPVWWLASNRRTRALATVGLGDPLSVVRFDPTITGSQAVAALTGAWPAFSAGGQSFNDGVLTYAAPEGAALQVLDTDALTVAPIAGAPLPFAGALARYGDRAVAGDIQPNRLRFSAAANFSSWPAANFIDIPSSGQAVRGLFPLRSALLIAIGGGTGGTGTGTTNSDVTEWWLITGTLGANEVLRKVSNFSAPVGARTAELVAEDRVAFIDPLLGVPAWFNGSTGGRDSLIRPSASWVPGPFGVVVGLREGRDVAMLVGSVIDAAGPAVLRRRDAWTRHVPAVAFSAHATVVRRDDVLVLARGTAGAPEFWWWSASPERPSFTSDAFAGIPSAATVRFDLPEWWADKADEEVAVRQVTVGMRAFATGDASPAALTVTVTPMRAYDAAAAPAQSLSFSEAAAGFTAAGSDIRRAFRFSTDFGQGFRLGFSGIRGVALQWAKVVLEAFPGRGVG
ncbi:MAG: hypothetical protein ACRD0D_01000 [Acidimicrobiales bacterium]